MRDAKTNKTLLVLGLMAFWCNGDSFAAAPLLVEIAKDLGLDISQAALSVTAYMLPFGVFTLIFGPLADRYGKARVINLAAFGTAIFSGLGAVAFDLPSLCLIRAINGCFAAAILPVTMSLVGDLFEANPKKLQTALGKVFGIAFLGGASGTVIGGTLAYLGSWRLVYLTYGIAELFIALSMLRLLERGPGTTSVLRFKDTYKSALTNRGLLKAVAIIFLMGLSVSGSFAYAGKFVEERTGLNILLVGFVLAFFGIASVVGGRITPALRTRLGSKLFILAGVLACSSWALMGAWHSPVLLCISLAGFGFGFIIIQPTLVGTAQQQMPNHRGAAMSVASFAMLTGGGLGTFLNGVSLNAWGYEVVFIFSATLILLAGILTSLLATSTTLTQRADQKDRHTPGKVRKTDDTFGHDNKTHDSSRSLGRGRQHSVERAGIQ
ncbi:MAG: MFS transporter [Deltaproteobacteria bacterium]|nr:MFS transporter [Deltaproteobacteria bacterium]